MTVPERLLFPRLPYRGLIEAVHQEADRTSPIMNFRDFHIAASLKLAR